MLISLILLVIVLCSIKRRSTSASEYMALGIPAIIIPSPYVTNNHQYENAKAMFDCGAAYLLEEKDLNVNNTISIIDKLMNDDKKLKEM